MSTSRLLALVALLIAFGSAPAGAQADSEPLRRAKELFFDRSFVEARAAWEAIRAGAGAEAEAAGYWVARCSENLGELERAFREYGAYLQRRPQDPALAEEARTSRVGIATRLARAGRREYLADLKAALSDPSKTVRYYAALQLGGLGPGLGEAALPVLEGILARETDPDLVDRAKLALLRLDPEALTRAPSTPGRAGAGREARWLRVRVQKSGEAEPRVSLSLPMALAELIFSSLPDEARQELKREGYDAESFWKRLRALGPTEIVSILGDDGTRIEIRLE